MTVPDFTRTQLRAGAPGHDTALTIGVLDGVHRGHQHLLEPLVREAHGRGLSPGVVTLHPHPMTVLRPETRPSYLTSLEDRIQRIVATRARLGHAADVHLRSRRGASAKNLAAAFFTRR